MRWMILSLLVAVTTINYLDRLLLSVLSPVLRDYFHFAESTYGNISGAFQIAYAFGYLAFGKLVDRYGTKIGLGVAAAVWSAASLLHATVTGAGQFGAWRALLGLSEGANFPACNKAVAEWFPAEERALATGIFNAGVNLASVIGPPLFVAVAARYGWRACFVAISLSGFVWLLFWGRFYRTPEAVARNVPGLTLKQALRYRQAWGFVLGKILVDPAWFFMLFWLPLYFRDARKMEMSQIGWAQPWIYFMSGAGSIVAGWLSGFLMRCGWTKRRARLAITFVCALLVPTAILSGLAGGVTGTILLFSVAAAAHQAFSSMAFTMPGDVFPSNAIATVQGLGGFAGSIRGVIFSAVLPGYLIPLFGYTPMLIVLSFGYLAAVAVHVGTFRDFKPVEISTVPFAEPIPVR
jgi:ACS family hexuronate transporter-like MFS transporter